MSAMFGTAALTVALGVDGWHRLEHRDAKFQLGGAALYLASLAITAAFHVPRNDRLATVTVPAVDAFRVWRDYSRPWTAGNHVRAALALAAAVLFSMAHVARSTR
jgi:uncharacterized membrane protein